jgi:hypothetical protein
VVRDSRESTGTQISHFKDLKRISENLANFLKTMVKIVQNHGHRIKLLEEGEAAEDSDDASSMEELNSLLAQLQDSEFAELVPSDEM